MFSMEMNMITRGPASHINITDPGGDHSCLFDPGGVVMIPFSWRIPQAHFASTFSLFFFLFSRFPIYFLFFFGWTSELIYRQPPFSSSSSWRIYQPTVGISTVDVARISRSWLRSNPPPSRMSLSPGDRQLWQEFCGNRLQILSSAALNHQG